jgi:hypothetical protein
MASNDFGDHWSITEFGFQWLADASKRSYLDMSRLSEIFASFTGRFGPGFAQRAVEAVRTYRTGNYLSACAMVGAAAESILLAVAIAKKGNEAEVLKMYQNSGGRSRVTTYVTGKSPPSHRPTIPSRLAHSSFLARRRVTRRPHDHFRSRGSCGAQRAYPACPVRLRQLG